MHMTTFHEAQPWEWGNEFTSAFDYLFDQVWILITCLIILDIPVNNGIEEEGGPFYLFLFNLYMYILNIPVCVLHIHVCACIWISEHVVNSLDSGVKGKFEKISQPLKVFNFFPGS